MCKFPHGVMRAVLVRLQLSTSSLFRFAVGWASDARGFGEQPGAKAQILNIVHATRTVMRGKPQEKKAGTFYLALVADTIRYCQLK